MTSAPDFNPRPAVQMMAQLYMKRISIRSSIPFYKTKGTEAYSDPVIIFGPVSSSNALAQNPR
jgi:hypothetical protein